MIKADLVKAMAKASGGSKVSAEKALNALLDEVFDSLKRGRKVTIGGFGTFLVSRRAERNGRNPRTQDPGLPRATLQAEPHAEAFAAGRLTLTVRGSLP
jgi:DNA-binding protein HU-beta